MKTLLFLVCAATWLFTAASASALELYNLDFTSPEVGTYQTTFGSPTVQSSVGPFTDALVFHAVTGYDQIQLDLNKAAGLRYDIHYAVLVHNLLNSQYGFSVILDTPEVRTVNFSGTNNTLSIFQPGVIGPFQSFVNDQVYHFDINVNLVTNNWTVAVNGASFYNNTFNATSLQDLRFGMAPNTSGATNAPTVYAALDNVVINVVPEPGPGAVLAFAAALAAGLGFRHRHRSA